MADAPDIPDNAGQLQPSAAAAPLQAPPPPATKVIVVIATGWGPLYGGINSFSFDFSLALGRMLRSSVQVICLTRSVDDLARMRARSDHVDIYTLAKVGPGDERVVAREACEVLNHHGITAIDLARIIHRGLREVTNAAQLTAASAVCVCRKATRAPSPSPFPV